LTQQLGKRNRRQEGGMGNSDFSVSGHKFLLGGNNVGESNQKIPRPPGGYACRGAMALIVLVAVMTSSII
jgi:hypothetical protein